MLNGEPKSFASDVFALAVVIWEIFERQRPFSHVPEVVAINQLLSGNRPPLSPRTPLRAAAVTRACWAQEPARRMKAAEVACIFTDMLTFAAPRDQKVYLQAAI